MLTYEPFYVNIHNRVVEYTISFLRGCLRPSSWSKYTLRKLTQDLQEMEFGRHDVSELLSLRQKALQISVISRSIVAKLNKSVLFLLILSLS